MTECLKIDDLTVRFGGLVAVNKFSMSVNQGEILSLIGPNGAGKTTVLNLLTGFIPPSGGRVTYRGEDITGASAARIALTGLRRTFQQNSLMFDLSVKENIRAGLHTRSRTGLLASLFNTPAYRRENAALDAEADQVLEAISMTRQQDIMARNLPFGDQRKLGIGIAMAAQPKLLLMDEPAAGLNPEESFQLTRLMVQLRDSGVTIILVEHDMKVVMSVSDRIVVLSRGEKLAEGNAQEISTNTEVLRSYLGDGSWNTPAEDDGDKQIRGGERP
ncbi:ABC transporter ATP-binding protein [Corticibacterium sp. UT-5YL-CI-8]|nr:ABC transporter ATP-binding protein [Tianweitania sp. UT-5YL-CI-8]